MENRKGCVNAYMNLSVKPEGTVSPCCMSNYGFVSNNGAITLDKDSISNFWNSKSRKDFIELMDAGVQVSECDFCWQEEKAGKESKRIRDNRTFKDLELDKNMLPIVLDLSMGNKCNLACRICSPKHSSLWVTEEKELNPATSLITGFFKNDTGSKSFDLENDYFWKDIIKLIPNVVKYDFAGGEPLFIEKHWDIVKAAVDNSWSKNQHIHYNTNGTIFPSKYIHLLEEFKIVDVQVSTDGVGNKFEYMRYPTKWEKVEKNIDRFIEARNNSKTEWLLGVCISISAFNVYYFFETFEYYAAKGLRIYVNVVHDNRGTRILPNPIKEKITEKLQSYVSKFNNEQWIKERDMICKHLKNTEYNEHDWKFFCKELTMRDRHRKQSFKETFPEYYKLINDLGFNYVGK